MDKKFNIHNLVNNKNLKPLEEIKKKQESKDRIQSRVVDKSEIDNEEFIVEQFIYDLKCTSFTIEQNNKGDSIMTTKVALMDPARKEKICDAFHIMSNLTHIKKTGDCSAGRISCKSNVGNMITAIIQMVMPGLCLACVAPFWEKGESLAQLIERKMDGEI